MSPTATGVTEEFVDRLRSRAGDGERLRRLPPETVNDLKSLDFTSVLLPARYGGAQRPFPEILDPVRRMAHGCTSSAWTIGFYALHNWMISLFDERAQDEVLGGGPVLAPAPLAPSGRGTIVTGGVQLSGRWSWATGVMDADWLIVGALCGEGDALFPALALLPAADGSVEDVWHTAGMRATGSNDLIVDDVFVPDHRLLKVTDVYSGSTPGSTLHDVSTYRWPVIPALALVAAMPALGTAEKVADLFAERMAQRVLAYSFDKQRDRPSAQIRLASARVRLRALRELVTSTAGHIDAMVTAGEKVDRRTRSEARLAAAHTVHESRAVIADLTEAAGASAHFLDNPLQRAKRDIDIVCGHAVFDYDVSRELAGALEIGAPVSPIAML